MSKCPIPPLVGDIPIRRDRYVIRKEPVVAGGRLVSSSDQSEPRGRGNPSGGPCQQRNERYGKQHQPRHGGARCAIHLHERGTGWESDDSAE